MADEANEEPKTNGSKSPLTVKLRKSVIANGDEVKEITFREPTAADMERVGSNPVIIDMMSSDVPKVTFDNKAMLQMMSLLAAVPPSTIRQMDTKDFTTACWSLANFFTPEW